MIDVAHYIAHRYVRRPDMLPVVARRAVLACLLAGIADGFPLTKREANLVAVARAQLKIDNEWNELRGRVR